jgi:hypothetical protein
MFHVAASNTSTLTTSRPSVWTGRALSGLVILFLVVDAAMKIAALPIVAETAMTIDWTVDPGFWRAMGLLLLAITALYAWPRIGAILLTGYLGGAVATHVRIGNPFFSHTLFGVYLGVALWVGLRLCDARLQSCLPVGR